jgi:hypothetical protein
VADTTRRRKIGPLTKQAKDISCLPPTLPTISHLVTASSIAKASSKKAKALWSWFFPPISDAGEAGISTTSYPAEILSPLTIYMENDPSVIKKLYPYQKAGSNGILFFILKCLGYPPVSYFQHLT